MTGSSVDRVHELAEGQSKCFSVMRENYATNWNPDACISHCSGRRDKVSPYLSELCDVFELWGENSVGGDDRLQRGKKKKKENVPSNVRCEQPESRAQRLRVNKQEKRFRCAATLTSGRCRRKVSSTVIRSQTIVAETGVSSKPLPPTLTAHRPI